MRVLMVSANTERVIMPAPPLGAAMVAALARRCGHQLRFLDLYGADDPESVILQSITEFEPEVIGISVRNVDDQNMANPRFMLEDVRSVIEICRRYSTVPLVLGGAGYSIFPEAALSYLGADYGIAGEGEEVFVRLLDQLETGTVPPGVFPASGPEEQSRPFVDFDAMPSAYPELMTSLDFTDPDLWVPMQTRRGCPYECSYCSTPQIEGRLLRRKDPAKVLSEVEIMIGAGATRFQFVDNVFNHPPGYARRLCSVLAAASRPIRWRAIVYPDRQSADLAHDMAAAGCTEVSIGAESGCDAMLGAFNKRFSAADVRRCVRAFSAAGISCMGFLLLGGPGETRETVRESLDFTSSLGLDSMRITVGIRIYPNTQLANLAVRAGVIQDDDDLLHPRFYLEKNLEGWIEEAIEKHDWPMPVFR